MNILQTHRFVTDLQRALQWSMLDARKRLAELPEVGVSGVERTLYPYLRQKAVQYLDCCGYGEFTDRANFFVIGEVGLAESRKRADGFVTDPDAGIPLYAIEVGFAGAEKFWGDYHKIVEDWSRTSIRGVFLLMFLTDGDKDVLRLDGAELRVPGQEDFRIWPLVLPLSQDLSVCRSSSTAYLELARLPDVVLRTWTITDKVPQARRWTTEPLLQAIGRERFLDNKVVAPDDLPGLKGLQQALDFPDDLSMWAHGGRVPTIITLQGGDSPLRHWPDKARFRSMLASPSRPTVVVFGDWVRKSAWEADEIVRDLLPVEFIGEDHLSGRWDVTAHFGQHIQPGIGPRNLSLEVLNDPVHWVTGFVKTSVKNRGERVDLRVVNLGDGQEYPFVVSDSERKVVFIASGVGGWGSHWCAKYSEGYRLLWAEILRFAGWSGAEPSARA